jgi:glycosyltransferase involved in cell wall biosynthesis
MKIGIFDPYLDDNGGGERYMMTVAQSLAEKHNVDVFWDNKEDLENVAKRFALDLSKVNLVPNLFEYSFINKQKVSSKYDAIIVLSDGSIPVLSSKKLYLHMQQPMFHKLSVKDKLKAKRLTGIFCNSIFTKEFIERNYKIKCDLLYPPVSIIGNKNKKENIILHVGRFRILNVKSEDYKKQQVMIDVFKELVDGGLKNWRFLLAVSLNNQNDPKFVAMKKSAEGYPIDFLINSSKDELWDKGGKAKIYWHATGFGEDLKKNPHLAEHFGISTVEAMGVGAVPVVINAGGQREIVKDGVNGFLWDNLDEFKIKTLELVNDPKLLERMSEEAYSRAKDFDEQSFSKRVFEIIK